MLSGKAGPRRALSPSHEHYLRAIWEVRSRHGYARLTDVARELGVSHPTLSVGLRPLIRRRLVSHDSHRFLVLTRQGERFAMEVHHRYRVMRAFLVDVLGVSDEQAEHEACLIEHDISAETTDRIVNLLKLMADDRGVHRLFHERLPKYHRSCEPGAACATCGLACLHTVSLS
jgi:DtxR family transcriptional regulator, Mn-dependent transcriptional regulator